MSKNWDKPISSEEFATIYVRFLQHHDLNPSWDWTDIHKMINSPLHTKNHKDHYQAYLNYCKIANSPLMKALS